MDAADTAYKVLEYPSSSVNFGTKVENNYQLSIVNYQLFCIFVAVMEYTLNCNGRLLDLSTPRVMGILNVTPDSFYADSRQQTEEGIVLRTRQILQEGGSIIDVGACSTRPGSEPATEAEEMERLRKALALVRREAPEAIISVDTFRPAVARMVVEEFGVDIINDVSEGADAKMFRTVARLGVPYILMSVQPTMREMLLHFAREVDVLRSYGQKDIILDPGFGFGKTLEQNYEILQGMEQLDMLHLPILVGVSRKSMIYKLLETDPSQALNGTTVLNTIALTKGASILRVHDVKEAVEVVALVESVECSV
jgi:dihydropteroate synthase